MAFAATQFPSILLLFLLMPLIRFIGIPAYIVIGYGTMSIAQAFLIAVYAYLLLYRSQKR